MYKFIVGILILSAAVACTQEEDLPGMDCIQSCGSKAYYYGANLVCGDLGIGATTETGQALILLDLPNFLDTAQLSNGDSFYLDFTVTSPWSGALCGPLFIGDEAEVVCADYW
ncbi:MAG: hypothetical protein AAGH79_12295 [Bacteroidota bacterium]